MEQRYKVIDVRTDKAIRDDMSWEYAVRYCNHINAGTYRYAIVRDPSATDYRAQGAS